MTSRATSRSPRAVTPSSLSSASSAPIAPAAPGALSARRRLRSAKVGVAEASASVECPRRTRRALDDFALSDFLSCGCP
jgi:hypothetical protein